MIKYSKIFLCIFLFSCSKAVEKKYIMPKCEIKKEAAYTVDEFIEVAVSAPASRDANGKVKRKTTAQENALLCAQREVVKFKTGKQSFNVHIQGGEIINKEFDDSQNCTLTYRIKNNLVR